MVTPESLQQAQVAQAMLEHNPLTAFIVGLGAAVLGLFGWLMFSQNRRMADRDKMDAMVKEVLSVIQASTQAQFVQTRVLEELRRQVEELRGKRRAAPAVVPPPAREGQG